MKPKLAITGAGGFLGRHLSEAFAATFDLVRITREADTFAGPGKNVQVTNTEELAGALDDSVDFLVHCAFVNKLPVGMSVAGYLNMVTNVHYPVFQKAAAAKIKTILIGSSALYGDLQTGAIDETAPVDPISVYGVAKAHQEMLARQVARANNLELVILRIFNLLGPGQRPGMLIPDWMAQAARIARTVESGERVLKVHTLGTARDFVDVRDACHAVGKMLGDFRPGEVYNVASGRSTTLTELVHLIKTTGQVDFKVIEASKRVANTDVLQQIGSYAKIEADHHWRPQTHLVDSLTDIWAEYSERT